MHGVWFTVSHRRHSTSQETYSSEFTLPLYPQLALTHFPISVYNQDCHECPTLELLTPPGRSCLYKRLYFGSIRPPRRGKSDSTRCQNSKPEFSTSMRREDQGLSFPIGDYFPHPVGASSSSSSLSPVILFLAACQFVVPLAFPSLSPSVVRTCRHFPQTCARYKHYRRAHAQAIGADAVAGASEEREKDCHRGEYMAFIFQLFLPHILDKRRTAPRIMDKIDPHSGQFCVIHDSSLSST